MTAHAVSPSGPESATRSGVRVLVVSALIVGLLAVITTLPSSPVVESAGPSVRSVVPARLFDSRPGQRTVDRRFEGGGRVAAGSVTAVTVLDRGGVAVDASAVVLNVTAVFPSAPGYLTVFPCGGSVPEASNVNYGVGSVVPNAVVARVGAAGEVCVFSLAATDLIVDVNGFVPAGGSPESLLPARLLETRAGAKTVDGKFLGRGRAAARSITEFSVWDRGGVAADASTVVLNVSAVLPSADGYLTVFPCGGTVPGASNVNYRAGNVIANAVVARVGAGGKICIFSLAETDLVVDVNGFVPFDGTPPPTPIATDTLAPPATTTPPPSPPSFGNHAFLATVGGQPIRWDPCLPITYAIDPTRATKSDVDTFHAALAVVEQATGLDFVYVGTYVAQYNARGLPQYTTAADVGVAFADSDVGPFWSGGVLGFGPSLFTASGEIVAGTVTVDVTPFGGADIYSTWIHELAHVVGLAHVEDPTQIMYGLYVPGVSAFGAGDLQGLWRVGAAQGCFSARVANAPLTETSPGTIGR